MNIKLTNILLAIIAACLLIQTVIALSRIPAPVVVRNDNFPILVAITNEPVLIDFKESMQLGRGSFKYAVPVTIEGFNGKPFLDFVKPSAPPLQGMGVPVEIVPK